MDTFIIQSWCGVVFTGYEAGWTSPHFKARADLWAHSYHHELLKFDYPIGKSPGEANGHSDNQET